jgi:hypothetical protein
LADSNGLQLILPRQLGELKNPEFINSMSMKIRELCDLQERMKENSSDQERLQARVNEILSRS